jgi:hypothetical protein
MGKAGLAWLESAATQLAHHIEHDGDGAISNLVRRLALRLLDFIDQRRHILIDIQLRRRTSNMQMKVRYEAAQGRVHVRRTLGQQAAEPKRVQVGMLTHQESKMVAAGPRKTVREYAATSEIRQAIVRIGK